MRRKLRSPKNLFIVLDSPLLPLEESRSEKFTGVISVMGRHFDWQQRSPRGGGIGGQVKMKKGPGADKFLSAPGLLKLTRRFERLEQHEENNFLCLCVWEY